MWPFKKKEKVYCTECIYYNYTACYSFSIFREPKRIKAEICTHPDNSKKSYYSEWNDLRRCEDCNPRGNCKKFKRRD